jgi:hypothetical protein
MPWAPDIATPLASTYSAVIITQQETRINTDLVAMILPSDQVTRAGVMPRITNIIYSPGAIL